MSKLDSNNTETPRDTWCTGEGRFIGGVPLGGIGAGTVELRADGSFREWQIFNNWGDSQSLDVYAYFPPVDLLNAFLAIKVEGSAYVLETQPPADLPGVEAIDYDGKFPFAALEYHLPNGAPIRLSLEAFSSFVPHQPDDSGIPAFALEFLISNTSDASLDISLAISMVNPFGHECAADEIDGQSIVECTDGKTGLAIMSLGATGKSILGGADDESSLMGFWSLFSGAEDVKSQVTGSGQRISLIVPLKLEPGGSERLRFVIGWFFPDHRENDLGPLVGHRYEAWVGSARDAASMFAQEYPRLYQASAAWRDTMLDASWPNWVTDWLVNLQANISKSSWWVKDGRFILYESFNCPNCGPIHIIDLADWPVLDLFPQLELDLLRRFADDQYDSGRLPEQYCVIGEAAEVQGFRLIPSITSPGGRDLIDLSPKYAVEIYHRYKETGDSEFLKHTYPAVKKAMQYAEHFDRAGVGLPSGSPIRTTWDHWDNGHIPSYTASLWLAGLLAARELAKIVGDTGFAQKMHEQLETGQAAMEERLWNGEYYAFFADENGDKSPLVFVEQIYGEAFASLVGLGSVLPTDRVLSALRATAKYNATAYGLACVATPDGKMVRYQDDARGEITICHMLPVPVALILHRDVEAGLDILKCVYDLFTLVHPGGLWNAPHHVLAETGERNPRDFGHYLRDQCVWSLLKVLNGWDYSAPDERLTVDPVLAPEDCHGPWITPTAYGTLRQQVADATQRVRLEVRNGNLRLEQLCVKLQVDGADRVVVSLNGMEVNARAMQTDRMVQVDFGKPIQLEVDEQLEVIIVEASQ